MPMDPWIIEEIRRREEEERRRKEEQPQIYDEPPPEPGPDPEAPSEAPDKDRGVTIVPFGEPEGKKDDPVRGVTVFSFI